MPKRYETASFMNLCHNTDRDIFNLFYRTAARTQHNFIQSVCLLLLLLTKLIHFISVVQTINKTVPRSTIQAKGNLINYNKKD